MEKKQSITAEEQILEAAKTVFQLKGFDGARMQDIAKEAGINQALLHYYYRSKDKLFQAVFKIAVLTLFPKIIQIFNADKPLEEKIEEFINKYFDLLLQFPFLPGFIMHEMSAHPERIKEFFSSHQLLRPQKLIQQYHEGVNTGRFYPTDPEQFFVNLIALCVFPFAARPIIQTALNKSDDQYKEFLKQRKTHLIEFIFNGMIKK
jgi:TetR/AcrR family transcriptional regulator